MGWQPGFAHKARSNVGVEFRQAVYRFEQVGALVLDLPLLIGFPRFLGESRREESTTLRPRSTSAAAIHFSCGTARRPDRILWR